MMVIGLSTFRELIRQKLIHTVFFIAILLFGVSSLVGSLTFDEEARILFHFGFSAIQISLLGISLLVGVNLLPREIERQTCLIVLSRPISRMEFFIGKWLGVVAINFSVAFLLTFMLWPLVGVHYPILIFLKVGSGIFFESLILSALAFFGSQFLRPAISLFLTLGVFILGHWLPDLLFFAEKSKNALYLQLAKVVHVVIPQLYRTDWKSFYFLEHNLISNIDFFSVTLHAMGWTLFLLLLGTWSFRRKDLV